MKIDELEIIINEAFEKKQSISEKSDKKVYEEESDARNNVRAVRSFTSHEPPKLEKKPHVRIVFKEVFP